MITVEQLKVELIADISQFERSMKSVSNTIKDVGKSLRALPLAGLFSGAISEFKAGESAAAKFNTTLKATSATMKQAATTGGSWSTHLSAATQKTDQLERSMKSASNAINGVGSLLRALPLAGLFGGAIAEFTAGESAIAKLDAVLKSTSATMKQATTIGGHWSTVTQKTGQNVADWKRGLQSAQSSLDKLQAKQSAGIGLTEAEQKRIGALRGEVENYTKALAAATTTKKVWVDATTTGANATHMERQAYLDLASALQRVTRFSDDAIINAEAVMATFTNIGQDVFPDSIKAALDLSSVMGQDLQSSIVQIGKALNDPDGITALKRIGVNFTDAQIKMAKALFNTGKMAEYQKMVLKELNVEFGGAAVAAGATLAGRLDILRNAFADILENIGGAMAPAIGAFAEMLSGLATSLQGIDPGLIALVGGLGLLVVAAGPVAGVLEAILSPLTLIAGGVFLAKQAWDNNWAGIRDSVLNLWNGIKDPLASIVQGVRNLFTDIFTEGPSFDQVVEDEIKAMKRAARGGSSDLTIQNAYMASFTPLDLGERIRLAFENIWPSIAAAISDIGGKIKTFLVDKLRVSPDVINIAENLFKPLGEAFTTLGSINWANILDAGKAIAPFAAALLLFTPVVGLFGKFEAFKLVVDALKNLDEAIAAFKSGDIGGALGHIASGLVLLGGALLMWNIGPIVSGGIAALASFAGPGIVAGLSGLAGLAWGAISTGISGIAAVAGTALVTLGPLAVAVAGLALAMTKLGDISKSFQGIASAQTVIDDYDKLRKANYTDEEAKAVLGGEAYKKSGNLFAPDVGFAPKGGKLFGDKSGSQLEDRLSMTKQKMDTGALEEAQAIIKGTKEDFKALIQGMSKEEIDKYVQRINEMQKALNELKKPASEFGLAMAESFKGISAIMVSPIGDAVTTIAKLLMNAAGVNPMFGPLFAIGAGLIATITNLNIAPRALGGDVAAGQSYLVGERGPELLTMGRQSGYVTPNNRLGGGGQPIVVQFQLDGRTVYQQMVDLYNKRSGKDFK